MLDEGLVVDRPRDEAPGFELYVDKALFERFAEQMTLGWDEEPLVLGYMVVLEPKRGLPLGCLDEFLHSHLLALIEGFVQAVGLLLARWGVSRGAEKTFANFFQGRFGALRTLLFLQQTLEVLPVHLRVPLRRSFEPRQVNRFVQRLRNFRPQVLQ